jgi:hypothetical protein
MKSLTALLAVVCVGNGAYAQQQSAPPASDAMPTEIRQHLSVLSPSGVDDYEVTQIQQLTEKDDKTVVLIRTASGDRLIATHDWNYQTQVSYSEIRDERSGEFLRATFTYPFATRTRSSTLDQAKKNPQLLTSEVPFEITARGNGRLSGIASHWKDAATAREWRFRLRQMVTQTFLEELEVVDSSGLFSEPLLSSLHEFVMTYVLYRTSCDATVGLRVSPAVPDCGFDKDFGSPCSEEQQTRAKTAGESKKPQRY